MITSAEHNKSPIWEVADIFRSHGKYYRSNNAMTARQHKVMRAIINCRTAKYGLHIDQCDRCGHRQEEYNSCRDRHCPKCQGVSRKKWVSKRIEDTLPVKHYHVVFTLPHQLHDIISHNRRFIFNLLFASSAATLLAFGRDPKWLGGEIGFYGVLHTWGQTMWAHPHVHYIVPGGALSKDHLWIEPTYPGKFLFPVRALSKVFRGKFIEGLKTAHGQGKLVIPAALGELKTPAGFERFIDRVVARNWVVYCKPPFAEAEEVVRYIGRYTHRVAISNHRIEAVFEDAVRFRYKDYRRKQRLWREMTLPSPEFIRRFLWHVLPPGFHKIRHYGFLSNGRRRVKVAAIRELLKDRDKTLNEATAGVLGIECPACGQGIIRPIAIYDGIGRRLSAIMPPGVKQYGYDTS
jgi:hypothetical protein